MLLPPGFRSGSRVEVQSGYVASCDPLRKTPSLCSCGKPMRRETQNSAASRIPEVGMRFSCASPDRVACRAKKADKKIREPLILNALLAVVGDISSVRALTVAFDDGLRLGFIRWQQTMSQNNVWEE